MDELEKFEASMPFDNIMIGGFYKVVQDAEELDGENRLGYVMYDKFVEQISDVNPEWKATVSSRDSVTSQILLSKFMQWNDKEDAICVSVLMSMALLHCPHSKQDTGKIFYQVLQGGGVEAHSSIAASDKDIEPCFHRMGQLVTTELIKLYAEYGGGENKYSEEEMEKL